MERESRKGFPLFFWPCGSKKKSTPEGVDFLYLDFTRP